MSETSFHKEFTFITKRDGFIIVWIEPSFNIHGLLCI